LHKSNKGISSMKDTTSLNGIAITLACEPQDVRLQAGMCKHRGKKMVVKPFFVKLVQK
jgi:regulator of RNase E activity RraA